MKDEMKESWTNLIYASSLPQILIGADQRVICVNEAAAGYIGAGLEGLPYVTALRQPKILATIERCLASGARQKSRFDAYVAPQSYEFQADIGPVFDRASPSSPPRVLGVLVTLQDVSEFERIEQVRQDFIANVSHELRTPLTSILGFIETLQGAPGTSRKHSEFIGVMHSEALRMARLIDDLLSLSRLESRASASPQAAVDVYDLLATVEMSLRPLARAEGCRVELPQDRLDVPLMGNADELVQLFSNLIENAIKYGQSTVAIDITTRPGDPIFRTPVAAVAITDDGPGIEAHHIPRITERFYRIDEDRSRNKGGTGLGLAISKHIITRHRGRLQITSTPARGSVFCVILPLSR